MRLPLWRRRQDERLDEELDSHLQMAIRDRVERGETIEAATLAARREFGSLIRVKEETRGVWGWVWIEHLSQDIRFAWRLCLRSPGFTATAVLSVALGVGANTAIFTLLDAVVFKHLPVADPDQLAIFSDPDRPGELASYAYRDYLELKDNPPGLAGLAARASFSTPIKHRDTVESISVAFVSSSYFDVFRLQARLGRVLAPADDGRPANPVAVISHTFWRRRFDRDPSALGRVIDVSNQPVTIVGIAPEGFAGLTLGRPEDVLLPITLLERRPYGWDLDNPKVADFQIVGRLAPGVSMRQAESALTAALQRSHQTIAATLPWQQPLNRNRYVERTISLTPGSRGFPGGLRARFSKPLIALMGLVAMVLLIACANVANLLLARASARHREIEVRLALGAGRGRLARQLFTESLLLAVAGGAAGVLIAWWSSAWVVATLSLGDGRTPELGVTPDLRVLAFTLGLSTLTGLAFGVVPVLQAFRGAAASSMRAGAQGDGGFSRHIRRGLVVAQVGVAVVLLVASALFVQTTWNLRHLDTGIDRAKVLLFKVFAERINEAPLAARNQMRVQLQQRIAAIPGVDAVALTMAAPFRAGFAVPIFVDDRQPNQTEPPRALHNLVTSRYFETLGIPLVRGRIWSPEDDASPPALKPAVINQALARAVFADSDPIGRRIRSNGLTFEIIGVVGDARYTDLREAPQPALFGISSAFAGVVGAVYVRTAIEPETMVPTIRRALADADGIVNTHAQTLEQYTLESISEERIVAGLSAVLGGVAAFLTAIGLYGVIAFSVARRTRELGVRVALGAGRRDILRLLVGEVSALVAVGLIVGLLLATGLTRFVSSLLFGISPTDGLTLAGAAMLMCAVAALACYAPARRALSGDPVIALRCD